MPGRRRKSNSNVLSLEKLTPTFFRELLTHLGIAVTDKLSTKEMRDRLPYSSLYTEKFSSYSYGDITATFDGNGKLKCMVSNDGVAKLIFDSTEDSFPCSVCEVDVGNSEALQCGRCSMWFHNNCAPEPLSDDAMLCLEDTPDFIVIYCPTCYKRKNDTHADANSTIIKDITSRIETKLFEKFDSLSKLLIDQMDTMQVNTCSTKACGGDVIQTAIGSISNEMVTMRNNLDANMEDLNSLVSSVTNPAATTSAADVGLKNITYSMATKPGTSRGKTTAATVPVRSTERIPNDKCDKSKTVVIDNIQNYSLIKHSSVIKENFNKHFKNMKIKTCFSTAKGSVFVELSNEKDAAEVITKWKNEFFSTSEGEPTYVTLLENKAAQGIIRSVPMDMTNDDLTDNLQSEYPGAKARRMKNQKGVLYSVILTFKDITQLQKAMVNDYRIRGMIFDVAIFVPRKTIVRCYNCLRFDHPSKWCKRDKTCHLCAGNHEANDCKDPEKLKCINCNGPHRSMSKDCPKYAEKMAIIKKINHDGH